MVYRGGPPRGPTALGAVGNGGPRPESPHRLLAAIYLSFVVLLFCVSPRYKSVRPFKGHAGQLAVGLTQEVVGAPRTRTAYIRDLPGLSPRGQNTRHAARRNRRAHGRAAAGGLGRPAGGPITLPSSPGGESQGPVGHRNPLVVPLGGDAHLGQRGNPRQVGPPGP